MSKRKPDIWVVLIVVVGLGVFATTKAESSPISPDATSEVDVTLYF